MAETDPGLQEEADQASIDFAVAYDSDAPLSRDDAFIAGYKAAVESRDQHIKELEELEKVSQAEIGGLKRELANALDLLMAGRPDLPTSKRAEPQ